MNQISNVRSKPKNARKSSRVPIKAIDEISAIIYNKSYPVINLSQNGLNISNTDHAPFTIGELIDGCKLILSDSHIKDLTARIIHCSCGSDGKWNNGIQWIDLTNEESKKIAETVSKLRHRLQQD